MLEESFIHSTTAHLAITLSSSQLPCSPFNKSERNRHASSFAYTSSRQVWCLPTELDHTHSQTYRLQKSSKALTFKIYYTHLEACLYGLLRKLKSTFNLLHFLDSPSLLIARFFSVALIRSRSSPFHFYDFSFNIIVYLRKNM